MNIALAPCLTVRRRYLFWGALKILYYQRRYGADIHTCTCAHTHTLHTWGAREKKEDNTENFKMIRPPHTLCLYPSLSLLTHTHTQYPCVSLTAPFFFFYSASPSLLSKVFDLSARFDLRESEFCKHIFHDHIATGKGSVRRRGRRRRGR